MPAQGFSTIVGSDDPSSLFIEVPPEVVTAVSEKKRPPVRVTLNGDYTYRSTVSVYGGRYLLPIRREIREACGLAWRPASAGLRPRASALPASVFS
jgi:hypothetical protein